MKTAAAYIRVSTDGQVGEDRFGLDAQREAITSYAKSKGITIVRFYSDEGLSGATIDRPALQEILSDSCTGEFSLLIVPRVDRLARDLFLQLWIEKELLKQGVEIVSATEPFTGRDPMTVAFRQMAGVFAELEKHRIKDRMGAGRKQKAKQGGYAGGGVPLGYRTLPGTKALEIDDGKVETVRRIFGIRKQHPRWMLDRIAALLNKEGHTTMSGKAFTRSQVWRVLSREDFYRGTYKYAGVEAPGKHPAILTDEKNKAA